MTILLQRSEFPLPVSIGLEQAILETLAYSDVFDYPLRIEEIHRYLPVSATLQELREALDGASSLVACQQGYYLLAGREAIVSVRLRREANSRPALNRAMLIGRVLCRLPFIRMVTLTGSLALLNSDESGDLDYMLVAAPGRVWTARGFALLLGRLTGRSGYTLCPNLIVSERALEWNQRDLYSAREICQMIPIAGEQVYARLRSKNAWTNELLPNASGKPPLAEAGRRSGRAMQSLLEWPLRGALGDRIERWEMERKVRRFTQQPGFGEETCFDADICQGNFDHHGAQTREALQQRLMHLGIEPSFALSRRRTRD